MEKPEYWPNVLTLWCNNFRYFTDKEATYSASGSAGGWTAGTGFWGVGRNLSTTLDGAHTATVTAIDLASASSFPSSGTIIINPGTATEEYVKYTGKSTNQLTGCVRGRMGSSGVAHDSGVTVVAVSYTHLTLPTKA